jgi:hypothetical protein
MTSIRQATGPTHDIRPKVTGASVSRSGRAGQALMWIAATGAAGAAVSSIAIVLGADGTMKIIETWRLYGLVVFAGLFALLALRPRAYRGVWELTLLNKLALTVTALAYAWHGGISGTGSIIAWDGGLSLVLIAAYLCSRGWTTWPTDDRAGRSSASAG